MVGFCQPDFYLCWRSLFISEAFKWSSENLFFNFLLMCSYADFFSVLFSNQITFTFLKQWFSKYALQKESAWLRWKSLAPTPDLLKSETEALVMAVAGDSDALSIQNPLFEKASSYFPQILPLFLFPQLYWEINDKVAYIEGVECDELRRVCFSHTEEQYP